MIHPWIGGLAMAALQGIVLGETLVGNDTTYIQLGVAATAIFLAFQIGALHYKYKSEARWTRKQIRTMKLVMRDYFIQCSRDQNHPYQSNNLLHELDNDDEGGDEESDEK